MATIIIKGYKCERCSHKWPPRGEEKPIVCPKCKSPYWNKPKMKVGKCRGVKNGNNIKAVVRSARSKN